MSTGRAEQFRTETPFLPQPLAGDVLEAVTRPFQTLEEGECQHARLTTLRNQVAAAVDTVDLAISQNHADYLGGRRSWSYDTSVEVKTRLRILKRQHQHLQDALGHCNRRLKRLRQEQLEQQRATLTPDVTRAQAFVQVATRFLAQETLTMLWELVETQQQARKALREGTCGQRQ